MFAAIPPAVLEVYYAPSCAPCRLELPVLAEFERSRGAKQRIVIVSEEKIARETLRAESPRLEQTAVSPPRADPRATLREAGDLDGILPYARAIAPSGRTCARWRGRLTLARARALVASCARAVISPRSQRS
jgi:hypothetical protein